MTDALLPCPFCGGQPTKGLTKKTGCQMHGDPIQYAIIGCMSCEAKPSFRGGCIYRGGDKPAFKREAYEEAAIKWNNRAYTHPQPSGGAVKALDRVARHHEWATSLLEYKEDIETIRISITQPKADVEGLKRELEQVLSFYESGDVRKTDVEIGRIIGYEECLSALKHHLAAQGYIGVPEGYVLYSKKNYERADNMFRFLNHKKMVQEFNEWRAAPKKEGNDE